MLSSNVSSSSTVPSLWLVTCAGILIVMKFEVSSVSWPEDAVG